MNKELGPMRFWHHQHLFEVVDKKVRMTDIVTYKPPFGFIGRLANTLFIEKQIKSIFEYRKIKMNEIFNTNS